MSVVPKGRVPEGRAPEARVPEGRAPEARAPEGRGPRLTPLVRRLLVVAIVVTAGYVVLSSPVSDWWNQRERLSTAQDDLANVESENSELQARLDSAAEPAELELLARKDLGMVREGEESYTVLPPAAAGLALPNAWPFNRIVAALESTP